MTTMIAEWAEASLSCSSPDTAYNVVMNLDESVSRNPDVMSGELVFAGTRVPVKTLFDYLAGGHPLDEFLADFPSVRKETAKHVIAASCETIELMCPSKKIA